MVNVDGCRTTFRLVNVHHAQECSVKTVLRCLAISNRVTVVEVAARPVCACRERGAASSRWAIDVEAMR